MRRRRLWFILAVVLQLVILLTMAGMKWSTLTYGTRVLLRTLPVDPWELFRGDYVSLNYEISRLDLNAVADNGEEFKRGETIYVTLVQNGKYWAARSVSHNRPRDGSPAIRGTVSYGYDRVLNVDYGISSYYVPQHEGKDIEREPAALEAEVSIDRWGNAALARLFFHGEELTFK